MATRAGYLAAYGSLFAPSSTTIVMTPAEGLVIGKNTPIQIDITDLVPFRRVLLKAEYEGVTLWELVHDGATFGPSFTNATNQRSVIEGGYRYYILRDGGWVGQPTITVFAIDAVGEEAYA